MSENNEEDNKDPAKPDSTRSSWRSRARDFLRSRLQLITQPGTELGHRTVNAGFWAFGLSLTTRALTTVRTLLVARLLAPEDFGLMGIALLMVSLLNSFTETGFKRALIQRKEDIEDDFDTAWTVELLRSFALAGALGLAAPIIADFFNAPDALNVIRAMAVAIFIIGFQNIAVVKFDRELEFMRRFVYRSIPTLVDVVVAVGLAFALRSVWALIFGVLARNLTLVVASYVVVPYRPKFHLDWSRARGLYSFGIWVFGSSILSYLALNLDDIVVGRVVSVAALGFYQLAFTLSQVVTTEVTHVINQVAFPAYSKLQEAKQRLKRAYLRTLQLVSLLSVPLAAGLWFVGEEAVEVFLGERWLPMVPAFNVLLLWGLMRSIGATTGPLFQGVGRPSILTRLQLLLVVVLAATIYPLTSQWGIVGAAWATVIAAAPSNILAIVVAARVVGARSRTVAPLLGFPLLNSAIMLTVLLGVEALIDPNGPAAVLLWGPLLGMTVYTLMVWVERKQFGYLSDGIIISRASGSGGS